MKPRIRWIPKVSEDTIQFKGLDPACANGCWECGDGTIGGIGLTPSAALERYQANRAEETFASTVGWA